MPLDHFKTQVLLLHSEQSTLDSLSSGFGDRYTVHCATSGSEALTTLGQTPINVIISAQKLPGMSGIEALREAKKRSPETIGILLAGNAEANLEAVVGDQEVFQIVRGNVTSESLKKLVDNATQKMRLMALAESANDVAANMDEPAEHIIMETDENGSTIISDGTGRFPALSPEKVSASSAVGSRSVDILVLTKDDEFLATIRESSRGMHTVHYASTLKQADEAIREHKVGVAVVDAAMVGEKVEQLTLHLRKAAPRLVSIVAGRRDDGDMLMDLINRGKVYRFLLKPVSPGRARLAVEASIKHHLEAPDAAFKIPPGATPAMKPAPRPAAAAKTAAAAQPAPGPKPAAARAPAVDKKAPPVEKSAAARVSKIAPKADPRPAARSTPDVVAKPDPVRPDPPLGNLGEASADEDALAAVFSDDAGGGGARVGKPVLIAIGAVAVAAIAGMLLWMAGDDADTPDPVVAEPVTSASPSITEQDFDIAIPGEDGIETSAQVDEVVAAVEAALLESRLEDAAAALQRIVESDPDNARLPFLSAQLQQMQLRSYIAGARNAIRDTRFEDAANMLEAARALGVDDAAEIPVVEDELNAAQSQQQVAELLALATARLEEGDLIAPANDNARHFYRMVLSSEPDNAAARQGLNVIASKLVLQARSEIDKGRLDAAAGLLDDARAIDATNSELAATTAALMAARDELAERERLAAEARRKKAAALIAAAQREEAERQAAAAAEAQAVEEEPAQSAAAASEAAEPESDVAAAETVAGSDAVAEQPATDVEVTEPVAAAAAPPEADEPAGAKPAQTEIVSIRSLTRTKYVAPKYPRAAERRGDAGWVDILFTVAVDGTVTDIEVRDSTPAGVFDRAAIRAVERWEFEPVIENGQVVVKRAGVRMMFALE